MKIKPVDILALFAFLAVILGCACPAASKSKKAPSHATLPHSSNSGAGYMDVHGHLAGKIMGGPLRGRSDFEGAARVALDMMDKLGIETLVVMPPPFQPNHPGVYDVEDLMSVVGRHPGRFAVLGGGGSLNVMIQEAVREGRVSPAKRSAFEKRAVEILAAGAIGFGEMTAEHLCLGKKHNHQSAPPDHPLFLLLADIAARKDVPIDIHMEAVVEETPLPRGLPSPPNPRTLTSNIEAFERLLAHNRKAKILWSHVGWDNTGDRTAALTSELLRKHANLYMSFKISPRDSVAGNRPVARGGGLKGEWLSVIEAHPDRFVIGSDQFFLSPRMRGRIGPPSAEPTNRFYSLLPPGLAIKVGYENAARIFKLDERKP
ncbi:MAG: amidohydrolase family protein [Desulfobacterales bacterium]|nr:amidohydrolase family protein [Desulfobacterales bacterium]